jgi:hypothetical protein
MLTAITGQKYGARGKYHTAREGLTRYVARRIASATKTLKIDLAMPVRAVALAPGLKAVDVFDPYPTRVGRHTDRRSCIDHGLGSSSPLADMGMLGAQAISQEFPSGSAK